MSQINRRKTSNPPPGNQLSIITDDGTITAVGDSMTIEGGSTSDPNDNGIETRANPNGSDDGLVVLTNRLGGSVSSVNGSTEDLVTFTLGATAGCYRFNFDIVGRDTATGDGVGYTLQGTVKTDGSASTMVAAPFTDNDEDPSLLTASINLVASGNDAILQVTGVAGQTIAYKAVGSYVVV